LTEIDSILGGLLRTVDGSRVTLRQDLPGEYAFPVTHEARAPGVASLVDERTVDLRNQPVVRELRRGNQVVQSDCRAALSDVFGDCDVLIAPAATGEAPAGLGSTGNVAMNVVWTLLHVPCVSVPMGVGRNGLPLGLQVIGRIGEDARTLACARWDSRP